MIPEIETRSLEEIKAFQENKLTELLNYLNTHSPFYKDLFIKNGIKIDDIQSLKDLKQIPFTTKNDLQERNEDFLCVPKRKIIDYITTSGTLGDPVTFALTDKDLDRLAYNECISFACADGSPDDIYQQMVTIDKRFMAGLAYYLGARRLGAGIIRVGGGIPELQWDTIRRLKPTAFIVVPSFLLKLIDYAKTNGIDYKNTGVSKAICIGESIRNNDFTLNTLGRNIKNYWPTLKLYSTYASTEMSAAFTECKEGMGGHHHPELIIIEFLDEQGNEVPEGQAGELVITTLGVEGMPLLRFKTGDILRHHRAACACGRNSIRTGPVIGRKQQMIKFKGTTLYPPALYNILDEIHFINTYAVKVYTNRLGTDQVAVYVNLKTANDNAEKIIKDRFRASLRVTPQIIFKEESVLRKLIFPENARKAIKFFDER
jgi:phenylacetate-CoA ligase